ncbi:MAG: hypothetical protein ACI90V_014061 [Bacillariaceae sp.]|jgi:hypothetical protein
MAIFTVSYLNVLLRITIIALALAGMATTTKADDEVEVTDDVGCMSIRE